MYLNRFFYFCRYSYVGDKKPPKASKTGDTNKGSKDESKKGAMTADIDGEEWELQLLPNTDTPIGHDFQAPPPAEDNELFQSEEQKIVVSDGPKFQRRRRREIKGSLIHSKPRTFIICSYCRL